MRYINEFADNSILITSMLSWLAAQLLKVVFVFIWSRKIDFKRFIGSGGMPSSHSAFVVSLAAAVGFEDGFFTTAFAISFVVAMVVMYDASGVRRAAGQQARILNKIVDAWENEDFNLAEKKLKELLGHTPIEVLAGAILGLMIAVIRHT